MALRAEQKEQHSEGSLPHLECQTQPAQRAGEMDTEMSLISKCCSANQGIHSLLLPWHCHPKTCTEQRSPCSPRAETLWDGLGWAGTGRTYAAEPARHQHMLRSPGGSTGMMTGFLWINQPAELLQQCSAPKHSPSSHGESQIPLARLWLPFAPTQG